MDQDPNVRAKDIELSVENLGANFHFLDLALNY